MTTLFPQNQQRELPLESNKATTATSVEKYLLPTLDGGTILSEAMTTSNPCRGDDLRILRYETLARFGGVGFFLRTDDPRDKEVRCRASFRISHWGIGSEIDSLSLWRSACFVECFAPSYNGVPDP